MKKIFPYFIIFLILPFFVFAQEICRDSDAGRNYYIQGKIETPTGFWQDVCYNSTQVLEGYCDPNYPGEIKKIIYACSNGCDKGSCQKSLEINFPTRGKILRERERYNISWLSEGILENDKVEIFALRSDGFQQYVGEVSIYQNYYLWDVKIELGQKIEETTNPIEAVVINKRSDTEFDFAYSYKILIKAKQGGIANFSPDFFIVKKPSVDLVLDKIEADPEGFWFFVCNKGNKDLNKAGEFITGDIETSVTGENNITKKDNLELFEAVLKKGECAKTEKFSFPDFNINQNKEYSLQVDLDKEKKFDELFSKDQKAYSLFPEFGFKVVSPKEGDKWGKGSRKEIAINVTGPQIWTKSDIKLQDILTGKEVLIDTIHLYPPQSNYWWTVPQDIDLSDNYKIIVQNTETGGKKEESGIFSIIEPIVFCEDKDQGKDYFTEAEINGVFYMMRDDQEERRGDDFCLDDKTLVEYFCEDEYVKSERYQCDFGCEEGRCLKEIEETKGTKVANKTNATNEISESQLKFLENQLANLSKQIFILAQRIGRLFIKK